MNSAQPFADSATPPPQRHSTKPIALIVLLENVGHIAGIKLPHFVMALIDFVTEEYAKALLHIHGAYDVYDHVAILEDELATGQHLSEAILRLSPVYSVDLLLLVHGHEGELVGYRGVERIGSEMFDHLCATKAKQPHRVDLRMVFGLNCYGISLMKNWQNLGAMVVNGAAGVNWLPEPSLSIFLRNWLHGHSYAEAIERSNRYARLWGRRLLRDTGDKPEHSMIASSRQAVFGDRDITVRSQSRHPLI